VAKVDVGLNWLNLIIMSNSKAIGIDLGTTYS
jgi:molecular chaperone DnaK (HSP70)